MILFAGGRTASANHRGSDTPFVGTVPPLAHLIDANPGTF